MRLPRIEYTPENRRGTYKGPFQEDSILQRAPAQVYGVYQEMAVLLVVVSIIAVSDVEKPWQALGFREGSCLTLRAAQVVFMVGLVG